MCLGPCSHCDSFTILGIGMPSGSLRRFSSCLSPISYLCYRCACSFCLTPCIDSTILARSDRIPCDWSVLLFGHLLQRLTGTIPNEQIDVMGIPGSELILFINAHIVGAFMIVSFHAPEPSPYLSIRMPLILQLTSYASIANELALFEGPHSVTSSFCCSYCLNCLNEQRDLFS